MSSYVINKAEYIKAAGLLAGIAEASAGRTHEFWIYDFAKHRNMISEDYYRVFEDCYEKNDISVMEQYGDKEREADPNDYKSEFEAYKRKGVYLWTSNKVYTIIPALNQFFQSALYQTEKEAYSWAMELLFGRIIRELISFTNASSELGCWGDLDGLKI